MVFGGLVKFYGTPHDIHGNRSKAQLMENINLFANWDNSNSNEKQETEGNVEENVRKRRMLGKVLPVAS